MKKKFLRFTLFLLIYLSIWSIATAQTVEIPDPILRDYIEGVLNKAAGGPNHCDRDGDFDVNQYSGTGKGR